MKDNAEENFWFVSSDTMDIFPLINVVTIFQLHSRFVLGMKVITNDHESATIETLSDARAEYGVPQRIVMNQAGAVFETVRSWAKAAGITVDLY